MMNNSKEQQNIQSPYMTTYSKSFLSRIKQWGQSNSIWPVFMGNSCCTESFILKSEKIFNNISLEIGRCSPKQSDLLVITGAITQKMLPVLIDTYEQMMNPKWVMVVGSCASSGGLFRSYNVIDDISKYLPVDVLVAGCPPHPDAIKTGVEKIKEIITGSNR